MRVIGGNLKEKKILMPVDKNTRPLRDLVRESIFNLLVHSKKIKFEIQNSKVLDLFSGSGSFGLECSSRGANSVSFFENYENVITIIEWPEKIKINAENRLEVTFFYETDIESRKLKFEGFGKWKNFRLNEI